MEKIFSVKNKTALITGASSGIGKHFALILAQYGAHIILVGRNEERLKEAAHACQKYNVKTLSISADVKDSQSVAKIITESKNHFPNVDILINAAGIAGRTPVLEITEQQWDDIIDINLRGTLDASSYITGSILHVDGGFAISKV